jgi:hypothetical protein
VRKTRIDKKYKFTKPELQGMIFAALMYASDGLKWHVGDDVENSKPLVMGEPEILTMLLVEALTSGLPGSEDSSTSATS